MENNFQRHIAEWREMNQSGRFAEARQYYFEQLFDEVIENFVERTSALHPNEESTDVLFSILGLTPEPIILAARALKPKHHIIFHDSGVTFNEDNMRYLSKFLPDGFDKIELPDESFSTIYDVFKSRMALTAGRNYTINITGGKKSMVAAASIFARDFNSSIVYVDYHVYDANIRRPIPGTEYLNVVYSPIRDLPELFHIGVKDLAKGDSISQVKQIKNVATSPDLKETTATNLNSKDESLSCTSVIDISDKPVVVELNISNLLADGNWIILKDYLDNNLHGSKVREIISDVTNAINSVTSSEIYWEFVNFILSYNPTVFMAAVTKADTSKIHNDEVDIASDVLDQIVHNAFGKSGKLKSALEFMMPYKHHLSNHQKEFILESCVSLSSSDLFYNLFKLTGIPPSKSIDYLLKIESTAAAFTLYRIFSDGVKNRMVKDDSAIIRLRPEEIAKCCNKMQESKSYGFKTAAMLIKNRILSIGRVDRVLINEVDKKGFEGFRQYVLEREQKIRIEKTASSLAIGDLMTKLRFLKSLDNYYLFVDYDSQSFALLDKRLTTQVPSKDVTHQATIMDIKLLHGKKVLFITKDDGNIGNMPMEYPPIINIGSLINVNFSQSNNGVWHIVKNSYCKLLSIEIVAKPKGIDYRKKQRVRVLQSIDFFTYKVELI